MTDFENKVLGTEKKVAKKEEKRKENPFSEKHIWEVEKNDNGKVIFAGTIVKEMLSPEYRVKVLKGLTDFEYNGFKFKLVK